LDSNLSQNQGSEELKQKVSAVQQDMKNLTLVSQKFIDEHLNDHMKLILQKRKDFEPKIDALEWLSRYANFYSPDNVYLLLSNFKDIYNGPDADYRNAYVAS